MSTFYNLPAVGEKASLLTHFVVREGAWHRQKTAERLLLELKGKLGADVRLTKVRMGNLPKYLNVNDIKIIFIVENDNF